MKSANKGMTRAGVRAVSLGWTDSLKDILFKNSSENIARLNESGIDPSDT